MNPKKLVAVLIIKGRRILAEVRKADDNFGANAIWIPGGHVEENESEEQAMLREMKEELNIKPIKYVPLCKLPWEKDCKQYTVQYYVCTKWKGKIKNKEASQLMWINENEIDKLDEEVDRTALRKYLEKQIK